jgi:hypothetical protein
VLRRQPAPRDDGQLTLLVIGYTTIAAVLVLVGVDASKVFLARRALSSAADSAALAAAQAVDRGAIYAGDGGQCGGLLPLDPLRAADLAGQTLADDEADLRHQFARLDPAATDVAEGRVTVRLGGEVAVPFGSVLAMLTAGDGRMDVAVASSAQSPVTAPGGC